MLVPRSFKYISPPPSPSRNEKPRRPSVRRATADTAPSPRHLSATPPTSHPVSIPPSTRSSNVSAPEDVTDREEQTMPDYTRTSPFTTARKHSQHDPNALPPAVAALLAVTSIPPRKPNRYRSLPHRNRRISIEEVVNDWKSDDSLKSSYMSSPALNVLLEDSDDGDVPDMFANGSAPEPTYLSQRSASSDSMPSLESDDRSILSAGSLSTPESLRSRKSYQNLRKEKSRSLPAAQDSTQDHPLAVPSDSDEDDFLLPVQKKAVGQAKARSSFKSNLTTSLQSLKNAAVSSISSLSRAGTVPTLPRTAAPPMDDMLWSNPFLFPRFSSEIRPATMEGLPSEAERRYLNPMPLTFEEQEAPFQQALHAPYLAEMVEDAPTIQLQTYNRGRRRGTPRRSSPNPSSEAGRALLGTAGVRQREVRENPDFLRVVVLEMNMRREGKLEHGRAKIWLPPRAVSTASQVVVQRVPKRWIGESAY